jgi:hypothetical protein
MKGSLKLGELNIVEDRTYRLRRNNLKRLNVSVNWEVVLILECNCGLEFVNLLKDCQLTLVVGINPLIEYFGLISVHKGLIISNYLILV